MEHIINYKLTLLSEVILADFERFNCGNEALDHYLYASGYSDPDAVTYIVFAHTANEIISYFSLSCSAIYHQIGDSMRHYPAVEIKNFATNLKYQHIETENGISLSQSILEYIKYNLVMDFTENICGASRIILYSVPDAVNFYKKSGFREFSEAFIKNNSSYLEGCIPMVFNYN